MLGVPAEPHDPVAAFVYGQVGRLRLSKSEVRAYGKIKAVPASDTRWSVFCGFARMARRKTAILESSTASASATFLSGINSGAAKFRMSGFRQRAITPEWPAAGLVDTEIGCFHLSEVHNAKKEVQPRVQA
ncbi:hypothetical protein ACIPPQ_10125 [Sphingopyxis sp. LARHCG72]